MEIKDMLKLSKRSVCILLEYNIVILKYNKKCLFQNPYDYGIGIFITINNQYFHQILKFNIEIKKYNIENQKSRPNCKT